jgi:hypothetical protein
MFAALSKMFPVVLLADTALDGLLGFLASKKLVDWNGFWDWSSDTCWNDYLSRMSNLTLDDCCCRRLLITGGYFCCRRDSIV